MYMRQTRVFANVTRRSRRAALLTMGGVGTICGHALLGGETTTSNIGDIGNIDLLDVKIDVGVAATRVHRERERGQSHLQRSLRGSGTSSSDTSPARAEKEQAEKEKEQAVEEVLARR